MAYVAAQLRLLHSDHVGDFRRWGYITDSDVDKASACFASGFFSDGWKRQMKAGDVVEVLEYADIENPTTLVARLLGYVASTPTRSSPTATINSEQWGTGTSAAGAITLNALRGKITTEALNTAAAAEYTLTVTNSQVDAGDVVLWSVDPLTSAGTPLQGQAKVAAGSIVFTVSNAHAANAFDAAIQINFVVLKG